jgi:hypothetical protein
MADVLRALPRRSERRGSLKLKGPEEISNAKAAEGSKPQRFDRRVPESGVGMHVLGVFVIPVKQEGAEEHPVENAPAQHDLCEVNVL